MTQLVHPSRQHPTGHEEGQADTAMEDTAEQQGGQRLAVTKPWQQIH